MLRAALLVLCLLGCVDGGAVVARPGADAARDVTSVPDAPSPDAADDAADVTDVPTVPEDVVPRRVLPPSPRPLAELVGFSLPGRDLPIGSSPAALGRRRWVWETLRALGVRRVRREVFWRDVEPREGEFRWDDYDPLVAEATAAGVSLLGVLAYGNPWATTVSGATDFHPPDDPRTFARYASAVVARYGDRVRDWEVWNEPNAGFRFWRTRAAGDPAAFGALVAAADVAVRARDPGARVAFGGTVFLPQVIPGGTEFVSRSLGATPGLSNALRAFAMHAYTLYPPRVGPEFDGPRELPHVEKVWQMAGALEAAGYDPARPLWITELGWPVTTTVTEELQARWLTRAVLLSALAGVDGVWLYELGDGPSRVDDLVPEDSFGIFRYDADTADDAPPAPKPAFTALRAMLAAVGALRVTAREAPAGAPQDVHVLALASPDGSSRGWAAWRADDLAPPWPWPAPPGDVTTMDGAPAARAGGGAVALTGRPVYVRAR